MTLRIAWLVIGPVSAIPRSLVRERVLLCVGEDPEQCAPSLPARFTHHHRGFSAAADDQASYIVTPFGSAAMEAITWELAPHVSRVVIAGTAGALDGFSGPTMRPLWVDPARTAYQAFDAPPELSWSPTLRSELPSVTSYSTDRFYGFSHLTDQDHPAEAGLVEAWGRARGEDAIVEMEVAAFFHFCETFGIPEYGAVKVVANEVSDLDSLPIHAESAMAAAIPAALQVLQSTA